MVHLSSESAIIIIISVGRYSEKKSAIFCTGVDVQEFVTQSINQLAESDESWAIVRARARAYFSLYLIYFGSRIGYLVGENIENLFVSDFTISFLGLRIICIVEYIYNIINRIQPWAVV